MPHIHIPVPICNTRAWALQNIFVLHVVLLLQRQLLPPKAPWSQPQAPLLCFNNLSVLPPKAPWSQPQAPLLHFNNHVSCYLQRLPGHSYKHHPYASTTMSAATSKGSLVTTTSTTPMLQQPCQLLPPKAPWSQPQAPLLCFNNHVSCYLQRLPGHNHKHHSFASTTMSAVTSKGSLVTTTSTTPVLQQPCQLLPPKAPWSQPQAPLLCFNNHVSCYLQRLPGHNHKHHSCTSTTMSAATSKGSLVTTMSAATSKGSLVTTTTPMLQQPCQLLPPKAPWSQPQAPLLCFNNHVSCYLQRLPGHNHKHHSYASTTMSAATSKGSLVTATSTTPILQQPCQLLPPKAPWSQLQAPLLYFNNHVSCYLQRLTGHSYKHHYYTSTTMSAATSKGSLVTTTSTTPMLQQPVSAPSKGSLVTATSTTPMLQQPCQLLPLKAPWSQLQAPPLCFNNHVSCYLQRLPGHNHKHHSCTSTTMSAATSKGSLVTATSTTPMLQQPCQLLPPKAPWSQLQAPLLYFNNHVSCYLQRLPGHSYKHHSCTSTTLSI